MIVLARPSDRNSSLKRTGCAWGATVALTLFVLPLLVGCEESLRTEFRQTAAQGIKSTMDTVLGNFFGGVDDILNDRVVTATGTAPATTTTNTADPTAENGTSP